VLKLHPVVLLEGLCGGQTVAAAFSDERRGRSDRLSDRISKFYPHKASTARTGLPARPLWPPVISSLSTECKPMKSNYAKTLRFGSPPGLSG
jgi:hypothetical protein